MKKSISLLITLGFIIAITFILIKDVEKGTQQLDVISTNSSLKQIELFNTDIKNEILSIIDEHKDDENALNTILDIGATGIPLNVNDYNIFITITEYIPSECIISRLKNTDLFYQYCAQNITENFSNPYEFIEMLNQYSDVNSKEKLQFIINRYLKSNLEDTIDIDQFSFINPQYITSTQFFKIQWKIEVNNYLLSTSFIYNLKTKNIVDLEYFLKTI